MSDLLESKIKIIAEELFEVCPGNVILEDEAICEDVVGLTLYEKPLIAFGSADDALFYKCKEKDVVGPWHMLPAEWMPQAKTVVSLFFPFSEKIKSDNRVLSNLPSPAWLHGRIEGQRYLNTYTKMFKERLEADNIHVCVPATDTKFRSVKAGNAGDFGQVETSVFGSNWSERHVAYICGLGTFGLSKGVITEKGMAGRFASMIIDVELEATKRKYTEVYEYCTNCGACIVRCPVDAISYEQGKNHNICSDWLDEMGDRYKPRYGCGLCQTKVPCESQIPEKVK